MSPLPGGLSLQILLFALVGFLVLQRVYYELTTGARRRRMIKEHGCQPVWQYPQKGLLGKTLGVDLIKDVIKAGKEERPNQAARERFWLNRNTVQFHMLRTKFISTIEPENLKHVLSTSFKDYSLGPRRAKAFVPVFGHGIFDTDGPAWERSRAMIRPNFTRSQVADLDTFETHISHLVDAVPRDGSTVDLQELFFSLTMDSATEFLFGRSTNTLKPGLETNSASEFVKAFVYTTKSMAFEFQSSGLSRWIPDRKRTEGIKTMHKFADEIVAEAIARHNNHPSTDLEKNEKSERYVFLHELVKKTQDPVTLRSELLNVLLAGRDTTAGLLANTWWVLARRPDIWDKLLAEIDQHWSAGQRPDYAGIKEMKYLKYVLNESLRLMPVVPNNGRYAVNDNVLPLGGGPDGTAPVFVAAGTNVGYSPWSMHRRTDFYGADSEEFRPERWEKLRPGWEFLPFNGGPRICLGQQFALLEASYMTIRLMQKFPRIEARDDRPWTEWITLTLASGTGTKVALFER